MGIFLSLLLSLNANATGLIYKGATATLSSTPSLVNYTTAIVPLGPAYYIIQNEGDTQPTLVSVDVMDRGYSNGVYTCVKQATYFVSSTLSVNGTLVANSSLTLAIQTSTDRGTTWTTYKTRSAGPILGLSKIYGDLDAYVPCMPGNQIRVVAASGTATGATVSTIAEESFLAISQIF